MIRRVIHPMAVTFEPFSAALFVAKEAEFLSIAADIPGDYWQREHFLAELPGKWTLSFTLFEAGIAIGYAILSRPEISRVHLHHFMVHAEHRGGGHGGEMIGECIRRTRATGAKTLSLKVAADSSAAQRFYLRHGFAEKSRVGEYLRLECALP